MLQTMGKLFYGSNDDYDDDYNDDDVIIVHSCT